MKSTLLSSTTTTGPSSLSMPTGDSPGAEVQDKGMQKLPSRKGSAKLVSVKYSSKGGYTPGDTWDLYVGDDNRIEEFVYHRGGEKKPQVVSTTWEAYKKAGPLLFSTDHRGTADGSPVRVSFSNIAVKRVGSESWIDAPHAGLRS